MSWGITATACRQSGAGPKTWDNSGSAAAKRFRSYIRTGLGFPPVFVLGIKETKTNLEYRGMDFVRPDTRLGYTTTNRGMGGGRTYPKVHYCSR